MAKTGKRKRNNKILNLIANAEFKTLIRNLKPYKFVLGSEMSKINKYVKSIDMLRRQKIKQSSIFFNKNTEILYGKSGQDGCIMNVIKYFNSK